MRGLELIARPVEALLPVADHARQRRRPPVDIGTVDRPCRLFGRVGRVLVAAAQADRELRRHGVVEDRQRGVERLVRLDLVLDPRQVIGSAAASARTASDSRTTCGEMSRVVGIAERIVGLRRPRVRVVAADQPAHVLPDLALQVRRQPRLRVGVHGCWPTRTRRAAGTDSSTVWLATIEPSMKNRFSMASRFARTSTCGRMPVGLRAVDVIEHVERPRPHSRATAHPSRLNRSAGISSRIRSPFAICRRRRSSHCWSASPGVLMLASVHQPERAAPRAPAPPAPFLPGFPSEHLRVTDREAGCRSRSGSPASPAPGVADRRDAHRGKHSSGECQWRSGSGAESAGVGSKAHRARVAVRLTSRTNRNSCRCRWARPC